MSGQLETSSFYDGEKEEENAAETAEHVRSIIEDCKKLLIPDMNSIIGAWGLIDNDVNTGDPSQEDMDVIVILTKDSYYIAHYDDEVDKVTSYQRVALSDKLLNFTLSHDRHKVVMRFIEAILFSAIVL